MEAWSTKHTFLSNLWSVSPIDAAALSTFFKELFSRVFQKCEFLKADFETFLAEFSSFSRMTMI